PASLTAQGTNVLPIVANKFIMEFESSSSLPESKRNLGAPHEGLYRSLRERNIGFDIHHEYNSPGLFVGVSLTLNVNTTDAASLLNSTGVAAIRPVNKFDRPAPVDSKVVSPGDSGSLDPESSHIGVDKLHALGITGQGVKIGMRNSYTHPCLGGGFGPGFKVAGGYDLVGDAYDGTTTPAPDSDPLDQCNGHGTHVAGIVGCNPNNPFNISGVAYSSELYAQGAFKMIVCAPLAHELRLELRLPVIVDGMLMAVQAGVDVITMSIGGSSGWTEGTSSVVASRIAASGKIVTIAAGNSGGSGSWYSSSPGNAIGAISVASSDNTAVSFQTLTVKGVVHDPIVYHSVFPLPVNGTLPLYATSNDTTLVDDACNPLPATTPDLSGFVVLVRRGTCTLATKLANIAGFGATVAVVYDDGTGFTAVTVGTFKAVLIQAADGVFLAQQLAAGEVISVAFPQAGGSVEFPDPTGGLVSSYTSYGPTNDLYFKPAITTPGRNILSTFPVPLGSWAVLSGTSMATPFMAGSSALLLSVKGKSPAVAKTALSLFESTSKPLSSSHTDGAPLQTVTQQGAGLVNVHDAIFATTIISPAELLLNDSAHFAGIQKFSVQNTGKSVKVYTLSHEHAGTAVSVNSGSIQPAIGPVPLSTDFASVNFNQNTFTLLPGQTHQVIATFTPPQGVDTTAFPVYSGFIHVISGTEDLHATYLGLAGALIDKAVLDTTPLVFGVPLPAFYNASSGGFSNASVNYTFVGSDTPVLFWRQAFGTPSLRLDLVSPNATLPEPTTSSARGPITPSFTFPQGHKGGSFDEVKILGTLLELDYLARNDMDPTLFLDFAIANAVHLTNTFANGTIVPNGSYRILLRSLRVTGDPTNEADYESWLSPILGVAAP
ncbi:subtilisin-like protease, partial [Mycena alexandri]